MTDLLDFIAHALHSQQETGLNSLFQSFLRSQRPAEYVKKQLWSVLFTFEQLKNTYEDLWVLSNVLTGFKDSLSLLGFYMAVR